MASVDRAHIGALVRATLLWFYVGIALAYGVFATVLKAAALFNAGT